MAHSSCQACTRISHLKHGGAADPFFITELRESIVVLHNHQPYEGWCVLLLKDHVEHLHLLTGARRRALMDDVGVVVDAVVSACRPRRINYECLGNVMPHVHWHIIPRYEAPRDPEPHRTVWTQPDSRLECGVSDERRIGVIASIRAALPS